MKDELNKRLPEYMIPEDSGSITLLPNKKITNEIKEYEKLLGIRIYQDDIIFLRVWKGCGLTNCHTIPILKNSEIHKSLNEVIKISNLIEEKIIERDIDNSYSSRFIWNDWKSDIEDENLQEFHPECIKIFTLVGLALIYMKSYEEVLFYMGTILDELIEIGKEYKKINTKSK